MKRAFGCIILNLSVTIAVAQNLIHKIKLNTNLISNVNGVVFSDGIFLNFDEVTPNYAKSNKSLIIGKDSARTQLQIPELSGKALINVTSSKDSLFFYYLEGRKKAARIEVISLEKTTGNTKILPKSLGLPNAVIGSYLKDDLFLASLDKESSAIQISQIRGIKLIKEESYNVPKTLFMKLGSSTAVIWEGASVSPLQAESKTKIYVSNSQIVVSADECVDAACATKICRIDRTSPKVLTYQIAKRDPDSFCTFIYGDNLYRISWNGGAVINIFNAKTELISSFEIDKKSPFSKEMAYFRKGNSKHVLGDRNVWDAMSNSGRIFISVHPFDSSSVVLKIGTHAIVRKSAGVPMFSGIPVLMMISLIVNATTMALDDGRSSDYYFYLKGNAKDGFSYINSTGLIQQKIDNYELIRNPDFVIDYVHKSYLKGEGSTWYGLYAKKKSGELEIVEFK